MKGPPRIIRVHPPVTADRLIALSHGGQYLCLAAALCLVVELITQVSGHCQQPSVWNAAGDPWGERHRIDVASVAGPTQSTSTVRGEDESPVEADVVPDHRRAPGEIEELGEHLTKRVGILPLDGRVPVDGASTLGDLVGSQPDDARVNSSERDRPIGRCQNGTYLEDLVEVGV